MEKVIIVGSGPAGLTAALYTGRANLSPLVLAGGLYGGQLMLTTEVENYPGFPEGIMGPELMERFRSQAERFGARIRNEDCTRVDFTGGHLRCYVGDEELEAESVIVATGASARWLGLPNEARLRGRGVSTCATCDGAFFRDKEILVVGGGDSAIEEAIFLTRFGRRVRLVHRRDALRASKIMADRAMAHPKIEFVWNSIVQDVYGDPVMEGAAVQNIVTGETTKLAADALFIAIGHDPNTAIFRGQLELDDAGYVRSSDGVSTSVRGVFVAGDVFDVRYKQAITAAGSGCRAALEAEKYLEHFAAVPS